jgi:hypothetical protein
MRRSSHPQLEFVGDKVLIPAVEIYCCVLHPSGVVIMVDDMDDGPNCCKGGIEAAIADYDLLRGELVEVRVMTAAEWREQYGGRAARKQSLKSVG